MDNTVDEYGLVRQGQYLVAYIPATETALVFRVVARWNTDFVKFDYGPIPVTTSTGAGLYSGGASAFPATGIFTAGTYTLNGIQFPYQSSSAYNLMGQTYDPNDLWYMNKDNSDRIYQILAYFSPSWLRVSLQIPTGTNQTAFEKTTVPTGITSSLGYKRGFMETIQIPYIHYGWLFGNDTNLSVFTMARFVYAEDVVEIPSQPETIFNVLSGNVPAHWITLPITNFSSGIARAFSNVYANDFQGFKVYPATERSKAIADYQQTLSLLNR